MRILALFLIAVITVGVVVVGCAEAHTDHADLACLDDCCQPIYPTGPRPAAAIPLLLCETLSPADGHLNDEPLARSHFRPPEAA